MEDTCSNLWCVGQMGMDVSVGMLLPVINKYNPPHMWPLEHEKRNPSSKIFEMQESDVLCSAAFIKKIDESKMEHLTNRQCILILWRCGISFLGP